MTVSNCCREIRIQFQGPNQPPKGAVVDGFNTDTRQWERVQVVSVNKKDWNQTKVKSVPYTEEGWD